MKKTFFALAAVLSLMLVGFGTAQAATSSLDNLPGGAGFNYFHTSANGDETLFNIQNVDSIPIMVHVAIWDEDSDHIIDFNVPLSGWDNWGCSITGDGTAITITPQTPCYYAAPNNGCFAPLTRNLPAVGGFQRGYISFVISAGDSAWYGGDGNGDPRNDLIWTNVSTRHYDVIFGRVALLNYASGSAIALNSTMLQGFVNIFSAPGLNENDPVNPVGWDSVADIPVPFLYNCDTDTSDTFPTRDDTFQGLNIDSWEIFLTDWAEWSLVTDDLIPNAVGDTIYNAVGSADGLYVGRYNEDSDFPSETTLITVFPANAGTLPVASNPPCGYSSRTMNIFCYDDNEFGISSPITSREVDRIEFGPAGIAVPAVSGECQIFVDAPLLGFTYTEAGNFADLYPLVQVNKWIFVGDLLGWMGHPMHGLVTEVGVIGHQETY